MAFRIFTFPSLWLFNPFVLSFSYVCDLKVLPSFPFLCPVFFLYSFLLSLTYSVLRLLLPFLPSFGHSLLHSFLHTVPQFLLPFSIPLSLLLFHSSVTPSYSLLFHIILRLSHFTPLSSFFRPTHFSFLSSVRPTLLPSCPLPASLNLTFFSVRLHAPLTLPVLPHAATAGRRVWGRAVPCRSAWRVVESAQRLWMRKKVLVRKVLK